MDLVDSCKDKLAYFRVKELKDVLTQLGLSKQGKKQDLIDRILATLSDDRVSGLWAKKNAVGKDEVAKMVDDTYRKMQGSGAGDLASKSQGLSDGTSVKCKEEIVDSYQMDKVRCLCGSPLPTNSMIKCEDPRCNVWQHIPCVVIPEKPLEGVLPNPPEIFYCEICRLIRADPFCSTVAHPLYPVKLNITNVPADGSNPGLSIEKTFQLTRADKDLLSKQEYDVQAWCMLLNDNVTFRMQWPQYVDLQVNGVPVRAISRPGSQLLGANGRDDGPIITQCTRDGINKISLTGCDARIFCVGVRIVKRRTLHEILNMIPKEAEGERFEDALARVRKCVGGGATTENADSDSDIEVVSDCVPVNLRCPMSGLRMKVAGRFKPCAHMGCFDLEVFVEMNQRSRKWQCPICLKNYSWEKIIIDPYFNRITSKMRSSGEDVAEIEMKPDGSWRVKAESDRCGLGELGLWHLPDGTLCKSSEIQSKPKAELKPVKQKGGGCDTQSPLKLGIKKNRNGCWEVRKPDDMQGSNRFHENFESNGPNIIPMSSSGTGSGRDGEDGSVSQGVEVNDPCSAAPAGNAEVIVLSDSEEETVYKNDEPVTSGIHFPVVDSFSENPSLGTGPTGGSSCLDLYNSNDEFGGLMWSGGQGVPSFQFFGSDAVISDPLVGMQNGGTLNCSSSLNGYTLTAETGARHSNVNDGSLVDNPLAFSGNDPSLQIFLPTRPSDASMAQPDSRDHADVSKGVRTEDWASLRLGNGGGGSRGNSEAAKKVLISGHGLHSKSGASLDSLADHAATLLSTNDIVNGKTGRERSDSPSSFPHQQRSVRPRLYVSVDSDSE